MADAARWQRTDTATQAELDAHAAQDASDAELAAGLADRVRSAAEPGTKLIRGVVDTASAGSIIEGVGFTIVRNGVGDLTANFTAPFSDVPTVVATAEAAVARDTRTSAKTAGSVRFVRFDTTLGTAQDGLLQFIAIGPA